MTKKSSLDALKLYPSYIHEFSLAYCNAQIFKMIKFSLQFVQLEKIIEWRLK